MVRPVVHKENLPPSTMYHLPGHHPRLYQSIFQHGVAGEGHGVVYPSCQTPVPSEQWMTKNRTREAGSPLPSAPLLIAAAARFAGYGLGVGPPCFWECRVCELLMTVLIEERRE